MEQLKFRVREVRSLSLFKTRLISLVRPVQLYGIHDLHGVRRLTQLRVGLSPIREHRFKHNFLNTNDPMCLSNDGIENTVHYMLLCQEYTVHRAALLGKVTPICASYGVDCNTFDNEEPLRLLLYGNDALMNLQIRTFSPQKSYTSTLQIDFFSCRTIFFPTYLYLSLFPLQLSDLFQ